MSLRLATRAIPRATLPTSTRSFSAITQRMAAGDTGAPRSGGAASSDAFTKREAADEAMYVRKQEAEKLAALKKKISDQEAALAKDRQQAEEMSKKQQS
ncbi:hypothetical protein WHR41_08346 [Cladosporium halotolerans]|uniref:ATPase inhibitor, mitochondrial n=1 Tax=Cladosporium halotolerans TaxID=1052096 RepID=A0AB34KFS2_9PEZI